MHPQEEDLPIPVGYVLRAPFYILFVQTLRFYHRLFSAVMRWAKRCGRRIVKSLYAVFCKPFALMGQGKTLDGVLRLLLTAAVGAWSILLIVPCVRNTLAFGIVYQGKTVAAAATAATADAGILRATQVMQFFNMPETPPLFMPNGRFAMSATFPMRSSPVTATP